MYKSTYYTGGATQTSSMSSMSTGSMIWMIIALILAIVGGFLVYFMFVKGKNKFANNKFLTWLKDFLDFKVFWIETIAKISYLILALFITLGSFSLIGSSFLAFVGALVLGNLGLRVMYEGTLVMLMIWKNTAEINKKTAELKPAKAEKASK